MKKYLKLFGLATSIVAAWFGLLLGGWNAYQGEQDTRFNQAAKIKEQTTLSYISTAEILKRENKLKDLELLNSRHLNYESAWRAEQDLSKLIQPMLDYKVKKLPAKDVKKVKSVLGEQESNDQFQPSPIILGGGYFAVEENDKAREYLEYAKEVGYDPPANAFLSVVYSRLSKASVDSNVRERLKQEALLSFKQSVESSGWGKPTKYRNTEGEHAESQVKGYIKFAFESEELSDLINEDPESKRLVNIVLKAADKSEMAEMKKENNGS